MEQLKRCNPSGLVLTRVVRKYHFSQKGVPVALIVRDKHRQHGTHRSVEPFHLAVRLWMIGSGSGFCNIHVAADFTEQAAFKISTLV